MCPYVEGNGEHATFFAQPVLLGKNGVETVLDYGKLSAFEQEAMDSMLATLKADIQLGVDFVKVSLMSTARSPGLPLSFSGLGVAG